MIKAKILVVEDERVVAEDIQRSLKNIGYAVSGVVSSGNEAVEHVKKTPPDLVLMDIVLRGKMSGIETAERIRALYHIPVVYLTAYADESTLARAKLTEPFGYILKPFNDRELHSTIEMALYKHGMEKKLRESEMWFSTTLKSIGDGVIATDRKGLITFMNSVAEALTGWSQEKAVGKRLEEVFNIIDSATGQSIMSPAARVLKEGRVGDLSDYSILLARDGKRIPIDDSAAPIRGDRGDIIGAVLIFKDITERKRAEEQLQKERDFVNTLLQASPAFYVAVDAGGQTLMMNDAMLRALKYSREEIEGKDYLSTFIPRPDREKAAAVIERPMETNEYTVYESHVLTKDHQRLLVEWHGRPVLNKEGEFDFYFAMGIDITERRRAEEALKMSEERYRGLFETMAQGVVYYDYQRSIVECNPAAEKILGMNRDAMIGRNVLDPVWQIIEDDDSPMPEEDHPVVVSLQKEKPVSDEVLGIVIPGGETRWVLVNATPVFHEEKTEPRSVFSTFTDITLRKQAEVALQKRNIQLNSLNAIVRAVSGTLDLKVVLDKALKEVLQLAELSAGVLFLFDEKKDAPEMELYRGISSDVVDLLRRQHMEKTSAYRRTLMRGKAKRFSPDKLLGGGQSQARIGTNEESFMCCLMIPIKVGNRVVGSLNLFGKEKYMPVEIDLDFFSSIGRHIGVAVRNARLYEETTKALEQLKVTQDKLVQSEKLAGLGALASNVVHEIGNPLAAISNSVQVLQKRVNLDGRMKELMNIIGWETDRLNRSVEQLREFSRPRHLNFKMSDLREIVKKAIILMNQDYELIWGRKIVRRFPKEIPLVWMDSDAMEQVALNLIKNGLQAVRVGGVVEVRIQTRGQGAKRCIRLIVNDDGPGIKEADLQRIFEPYFSTKARGIGLGMHIVKQIVESHGGTIKVNSEAGKGTTVLVDIPIERMKDG